MAQELVIGPADLWSWEAVTDLFLGGLAAGLMIFSGWAYRRKPEEQMVAFRWAAVLPPILLAAGVLALLIGQDDHRGFFRYLAGVRPLSPVWWGIWILAVSLVSSTAFALQPRWRPSLATPNVALGIVLGLYTGALLSAFGARPLWNAPVLGPVFLFSGLANAVALLALIERDEGRRRLELIYLLLIGLEFVFLLILIAAMFTGPPEQREAAYLFFGGPFTTVFWVGVVGGGLVLPAALAWMQRSGWIRRSPLPPILVLLGGVGLRVVLLAAGQVAPWTKST
jgi:protein NrfD